MQTHDSLKISRLICEIWSDTDVSPKSLCREGFLVVNLSEFGSSGYRPTERAGQMSGSMSIRIFSTGRQYPEHRGVGSRRKIAVQGSCRDRLLDRAFGLDAYCRTALMFALNCFVDFLTVHGNFGRGFNPQPDFVAANVDDGDLDVVADENAFIALAG